MILISEVFYCMLDIYFRIFIYTNFFQKFVEFVALHSDVEISTKCLPEFYFDFISPEFLCRLHERTT